MRTGTAVFNRLEARRHKIPNTRGVLYAAIYDSNRLNGRIVLKTLPALCRRDRRGNFSKSRVVQILVQNQTFRWSANPWPTGFCRSLILATSHILPFPKRSTAGVARQESACLENTLRLQEESRRSRCHGHEARPYRYRQRSL